MTAVTSGAAGALRGTLRVPGDKSISHRALMLAASAAGETVVHGLLEGDDVLATAAAMEALGATIERGGGGEPWRIHGRGVGGLAEPGNVLDLGNAGTAARLLTGLLAGQPFNSTLTGDASLVGRPMARVTGPLERMGGRFTCRSGRRLPMTVHGTDQLRPIVETPDVASAQVKSAILLAGLTAPGRTTVIERRQSRDHTERMLRSFGAEVAIEENGGRNRPPQSPANPNWSRRKFRFREIFPRPLFRWSPQASSRAPTFPCRPSAPTRCAPVS